MFRADIQGLRAIAVGAVVLNHAGVPGFAGGYIGVDVFFVISGFLITSHLARSRSETGRINLRDFWARRARRILPASFAVLVASIVGSFIWIPPLLREQTLRDAAATALYVPNYAFAVHGTDYLAETSPSLFQHYWSLGVEEQFYLFWPLILMAVFAVSQGGRGLLAVVGVIAAASFLACLVLTTVSQPWAFFSLWSRAWEFAAGGLIGLLLMKRERIMPARVSAFAGWLGLGMIAAGVVLFSYDTVFPGIAVTLPVIGTALLIAADADGERRGPRLLLGTPPLQFIGRISYSLYLVHWPILIFVTAALGADYFLPWWATGLVIVGAVPVAWLLYRFVENPARTSPRLVGMRPARTLALAGTGSAGIAIAAVVGLTVGVTVPLDGGRTVQVTAPSDPPIITSFVPSNMTPTLYAAADDNPALYELGCELGFSRSTPLPCDFGSDTGTRVVLFGDSHAAHWFPALESIADTDGYHLQTHTKSGCASVDVRLLRDNTAYASCDTWRKEVIADLRADPPDLVVLANYTNPEFATTNDKTGQWERGLRKTIDQLSEVTRVVVIADTPDLRVNPAACLAEHLTTAKNCGQPSTVALQSPGRAAEVAATAATHTPLIDLTGYFCTPKWCPALIGNTLAYRDSHHLTATYSAELAGVLRPQLQAALGG
ncbi:MAG TPA: acyltransferase family protein [Pseudolysinimonas sp.]|nr:acyltransferase family protein [Pseudolysinimonas sp.]